MTSLTDLDFDFAKLQQLCRDRGIVELQFFGSAVRGAMKPESDLDILVRFDPGRVPGLFELGEVQSSLTELFGRQVHLHTDSMIPPKHRDYFLRGAVRAYAA